MDFRNLCQKIDVDSIRAKIPPMPAIPIPQIKLPKSIPKLKSRKIFRSSRENVNANASPKHALADQSAAPPPIPPADFIDHIPKRISTIGSFMHQEEDTGNQSTYRSACSVDDDYSTPTQPHTSRAARPISPVQAPAVNSVGSPNNSGSNGNSKLSFTEKLQKGYKDISEFRLKHIFAKKTVVRKDTIQVDQYVEHYNEDLQREAREQERRDLKVAENYRFKFKESRQNTGHTNSLTSNDSPVSEPEKHARTFGHESGDESGMEASPPNRKPGIASTRFCNVRKPPKSLSEEQNPASTREIEEAPKPEPIPSTLWSTKINRTSVENSPTEKSSKEELSKSSDVKAKTYKERLRRFTSYVSQSLDESGVESGTEAAGGKATVMSHLRNLGKRSENVGETAAQRKRKAPLSPQQSEDKEEQQTSAPPDNTLTTIKQNFKRLQKSIKRPQSQPPTEDSEDDESSKEPKSKKVTSRTEKFTSRLRKFRSRDDVANETPKRDDAAISPVHNTITNKLQTWKKSFKQKSAEVDANTGDETSPEKVEKEKRSNTLIKKLKCIRSRKTQNSNENLDVDEDDESGTRVSKDAKRKTSNLEEKFVQARQRTFKKVNEKVQNIKLFHRSQEQVPKSKENSRKSLSSDDEDYDEADVVANKPSANPKRNIYSHSEYQYNQEEVQRIAKISQEYGVEQTRAVWTTKSILSDSLDTDTDTDCPRVLIHQDNSDLFESTLIIAVTRPAPSLPSPIISEIPNSPKIREITPKKPTRSSSPHPVDWIPNKDIISNFLEMTPPMEKKEIIAPPRGHTRKISLDSNSNSNSNSDSDSWIPNNQGTDGIRRTSALGLNRIDENEEPWKVHTMFRDEKLYKTKSIDIFDKTKQLGGVLTAFEDFDDELKGEPVVKISNSKSATPDGNESSEDADAADDDNSSRITKILVEKVEKETVSAYGGNAKAINASTDLKQVTHLESSQKRHFRNSQESLFTTSEDNDSGEESDRPPSAAPSPPPAIAPPPPPLPQRKTSMRHNNKPSKEATPPLPPLPTTRPPPLPSNPPPKIPARTTSMSRISKPLVKTASLRLAYNEQIKPADVGKVNKLISCFEPEASKTKERPRVIRRVQQDDSEEYTDDEYDDQETDKEHHLVKTNMINSNAKSDHDLTPTPTNTPKSKFHYERGIVPDIITVVETKNVDIKYKTTEIQKDVENKNSGPKSPLNIPKISLELDKNFNLSRPSSEYGSPLEYPSSLMGSTETTPVPDRREQDLLNIKRSRRSMTRDDERFFSFDSDEENSYYSISSQGSSRYIVEI